MIILLSNLKASLKINLFLLTWNCRVHETCGNIRCSSIPGLLYLPWHVHTEVRNICEHIGVRVGAFNFFSFKVAYKSTVYFTVHTSLLQMFLKLTGQAHPAYNNIWDHKTQKMVPEELLNKSFVVMAVAVL